MPYDIILPLLVAFIAVLILIGVATYHLWR